KQHYMMSFKATPFTEAGTLPPESLLTEMGGIMGDMAKAGVLLGGEGLQPSRAGARVAFAQGKQTIVDGPFAEAKELVCGFWIMECSSEDEALAWTRRGLECHGEGESETRLLRPRKV